VINTGLNNSKYLFSSHRDRDIAVIRILPMTSMTCYMRQTDRPTACSSMHYDIMMHYYLGRNY